ncbi:MAG: helix-turn-helix domain-containing protein [Alphaproteobacteria bacterium]
MAKALHHPAMKDITLDQVLHALADPMRRKILFRLAGCAGMNCGTACDELPASTLSFHYRVLREAGLIRSRKKGVEVISIVRKADIERRFPGLLHSIFQHHKAARPKKKKA